MKEAVAAPSQASKQAMAMARTPESLRQRQRDRLSPRGRFGRTGPISTTVRDVEVSPASGITLSPAPRPKAAANRSQDSTKKQNQEGLRKENSVHRWAKKDLEDVKSDITPDGGSAGREGRQFTVANVGNNGRIYLRYVSTDSDSREAPGVCVCAIDRR
jgi:hypothetical protein